MQVVQDSEVDLPAEVDSAVDEVVSEVVVSLLDQGLPQIPMVHLSDASKSSLSYPFLIFYTPEREDMCKIEKIADQN